MQTGRRSFVQIAVGALLGARLLPVAAQATSDWRPDKPVRLVVGFAAGSGSDAIARLIAPGLGAALGQSVVVENRAGAGGVVAAEYVARAPADGSTWLLAPSGHATAAAMRKSLPFRPVADFAWISPVTVYPLVIAVAPSSPYRTFDDVIRAARGKSVSFSSVGLGTAHHLIGEWLNAEAGVNLLHVPFKGGAAAVTEVLAGRVDVMIDTMTFVLPMIQSGQLRALAVTSAAPVAALPNVPPTAATVPGVAYDSWLGLALPGGTRPEIVAAANTAVRKVLADPAVQKRLADLGGQASPSTPEAFRAQVEGDIARFTRIVESRKIERE